MNKAAALIMTLSLGALLTGCEAEQTEKDMIAEAQFCLDDARDAASADSCLSKISGLTSPQAYTLRCAGGFIAAEITSPEKLSTALNAISDGGGATTLLSSLSFPTTQLADTTFNSCNLSNQNGLKLIGAMAKSATVLASMATSLSSCTSITDCSAAEIESTIDDLIAGVTGADPDAEAAVIAIVSSVQTVYASTCGGTNNANSDICGQITSAVAQSNFDITTTDPAELLAIGQELLGNWKN